MIRSTNALMQPLMVLHQVGTDSAAHFHHHWEQLWQVENHPLGAVAEPRQITPSKAKETGAIISLVISILFRISDMYKITFIEQNVPNSEVEVQVYPPSEQTDGTWVAKAKLSDKSQASTIVSVQELFLVGEDPFQSQILLFESIRTWLEKKGTYELNNEPLWAVLPRYVPYSYGRSVAREIEEFIDFKIQIWNEQVEKKFGLETINVYILINLAFNEIEKAKLELGLLDS